MSYRLIDANALSGVISNDDYEKVLNAPCIFVDLPNGLDGGHYNLQEPVLDKIRAKIEQLTSRYTVSRERGCTGQVEWSDRLIKESEVLQIIDKYMEESEGV